MFWDTIVTIVFAAIVLAVFYWMPDDDEQWLDGSGVRGDEAPPASPGEHEPEVAPGADAVVAAAPQPASPAEGPSAPAAASAAPAAATASDPAPAAEAAPAEPAERGEGASDAKGEA